MLLHVFFTVIPPYFDREGGVLRLRTIAYVRRLTEQGKKKKLFLRPIVMPPLSKQCEE